MATQSSKTYLQLVNDTIDEAGAELASFAANGSDFNTVTDAMMNRFKKWVKRAWLTIQQEQFDWEWMQSLAVVNLTPGIMFYSDTPISWELSDLQPYELRDVDGTTQIENLNASAYIDLSDTHEGAKNLAVIDTQYADYTIENEHALDFGLKAGGWKLFSTRQKARIITRNIHTNTIDYVVVGNHLDQVDVAGLDDIIRSYTITNGVIDSVVNDGEWVQIDFSYDDISGDFWNALITRASNSSQTLNAWNLEVRFNVVEGPPSQAGIIAALIPDGSSQSTSINRGGLTPITFSAYLKGSEVVLSVPSPGGGLANDPWQISQVSSSDSDESAYLVGKVLELIPGTIGYFDFRVLSDASVFTSISPYSSTYAQLLMLVSPGLTVSNDRIDFNIYNPDNGNLGVVRVSKSDVELAFTLEDKVPGDWYVHSWKSFKWEEEQSANDYVSDVREIDQSTFALIRHDTIGVTEDLPLQFIPWSSFQGRFDKPSMLPGQPTLVTEDPTGRWRFYPALDRPYTVTFRYGRQAQELVDWNDVPKGIPQEYEDLIMWRALQYYGEYDEQPSVANRGRGNYKNLLLRFERQTRPKFYFKAKQLY